MARKVVEHIPDSQLMADLERYRQMVIEWGATDAKIVGSNEVVIDERTLMKCRRCPYYGTNPHCPPYAATPQEMRVVVGKYRYAILYSLEGPPSIVAGPREARVPTATKVSDIAVRLEGTAFYDGYYWALGFASGSCKNRYCSDIPCLALIPGGQAAQACPVPYKVRSSPEACGVDMYLMSIRAGWDIYPCGVSTKEEDVPFGRRLGLVLIY